VEDHCLHAILVTRWGRRQKKGEGYRFGVSRARPKERKWKRKVGRRGRRKEARGKRDESFRLDANGLGGKEE
jgi:hypothetical protein